MRKFFILFVALALFPPLFAQTGDPGRMPRYDRLMDYIKNGQFTFTYKTLTSPTLAGTVTNSATNNFTGAANFSGNANFTDDSDSLKINLYQALYPIDLEIGDARVFGVDSTGIVMLKSGGTFDNSTNNTFEWNENSDELIATFGSNTVTWSSGDVTAINYSGGISSTWAGSTSGGIKIAPIATGTATATIQNQNVSASTITLPSATTTLPGLSLSNVYTSTAEWDGSTSGGIKIAPIATGTALTTIQNQNISAATITLPSATTTLPGLSLANAWTGANTVPGGTATVPLKVGVKSNSDSAGLILVGSTDNTGGIQVFADDGGKAAAEITSPIWTRYLLTIGQTSGATQAGVYNQLKTEGSLSFTDGSIVAAKIFNQGGTITLAGTAEYGIINAGATLAGTMTVASGTMFSGVDVNLGGVGPVSPSGTGISAGVVIRSKGEGAVWPIGLKINDSGAAVGIDIGTCTTDLRLQNEETFTNATNANVALTFNDDAATLGALYMVSSNDTAGLAPADNMIFGFKAYDGLKNVTTYATLTAILDDTTNNSEDASLKFGTITGATMKYPLILTSNYINASAADSMALGSSNYIREIGRTAYGDSIFIVVWAKNTTKDTVFFALN
ncbi:MAG: hypothetical protein PHX83_12100 [Acidobacteriia bacterium]|nr:hypothetical protein [Terriglobia bacterium]